jgi:hypothetical protein
LALQRGSLRSAPCRSSSVARPPSIMATPPDWRRKSVIKDEVSAAGCPILKLVSFPPQQRVFVFEKFVFPSQFMSVALWFDQSIYRVQRLWRRAPISCPIFAIISFLLWMFTFQPLMFFNFCIQSFDNHLI